MLEEHQMGSQTLEILRQGVWASLTGGWFYDPHQDVFCNTFHLYLWLFLLCLPFTIYVYFPPTKYMWYFYCASVAVALTIVKLVNYGLHHMYDTTDCIQEEVEDEWQSPKAKEDEGIELQVLSSKTSTELPNKAVGCESVGFYEPGLMVSTDVDSLESGEFQRTDNASLGKQSSTIDLKAEVHRKNSSESSEELSQSVQPVLEIVSFHSEVPIEVKNISIDDTNAAKRSASTYRKLPRQAESCDSQHPLNIVYAGSSQSQTAAAAIAAGITSYHTPRRHSHFTNSTFCFLPPPSSSSSKSSADHHSEHAMIKPTGSLELGYIDHNPNQSLTPDGFYFKQANDGGGVAGVRRIRSTALETCCPPPPGLTIHPNSLEFIGAYMKTKNPLPPPSSRLVRNQHVWPYYGSEIVYPIAEQSDEQQHSHGADTDADDSRNSDSDYEEEEDEDEEEANQGSRSPLLMRLHQEPQQHVGYSSTQPSGKQTVLQSFQYPKVDTLSSNTIVASASGSGCGADGETASATSKDGLLDEDREENDLDLDDEGAVARGGVTHQYEASRRHCADWHKVAVVGEMAGSKYDGTALSCSNSSLDMECDDREGASAAKPLSSAITQSYPSDIAAIDCDKADNGGGMGAVRKRNIRKTRKRKSNNDSFKIKDSGNCSSLVELDLDWLFDDENEHLRHCKEPLKRDTEWSSITTVSLEQDVSKVLQETVPPTRSLGAIPKKLRHSASTHRKEEKPCRTMVMKSESDRCCRRKMDRHTMEEKHFNRNRSVKEGRRFQHPDCSVTGLECLVLPPQQQPPQPQQHTSILQQPQQQPRLCRLSVSRRSTAAASAAAKSLRHSHHHHHNLTQQHSQQQQRTDDSSSPSSGSNHELSTLLPTQPLLQAFLASRREFPMLPICLPAAVAVANERGSPPPLRRGGSGGSVGGAAIVVTGNLKRVGGLTRRTGSRVVQQRDTAIANTLSAGNGTHSAKSFNDTSDGAVHCFVDEHGNLVTYTFDEKGLGTANTAISKLNSRSQSEDTTNNNSAGSTNKNKVGTDVWDSNSTESICNSTVSVILDSAKNPVVNSNLPAPRQMHFHHRPSDNDSLNHVRVISCMGMYPGINMVGQPTTRNRFQTIQTADTLNNNYPRTKSYYKFKVSPWTFVKVSLDRLKLLALLDRNLSLWETIVSIFLGVLVSIFGALMLHLGFYRDFSAFIFCFVMASCQYSLLKSVQPDAASPTHGFNKIVAYSRPIYFCIVSTIILILHLNIVDNNKSETTPFLLYGMKFTDREMLILLRDFFHKFILYFPFLFSLGLFPQINTFILYFFEQIDMHVFGGNAMSSLAGAFYCIFRSFLSVIVMYGLVFGALSERKSSQHILFSMFCACLVSSSYHLSRSASDPTHVWNMLKKHLWPPDLYREHRRTQKIPAQTPDKSKQSAEKPKVKLETPTKDVDTKTSTTDLDEDESDVGTDPLPDKLRKTVNARMTSDVLLCGLVAFLVFGIHCSTVFTVLQPELNPVLWGIAGAMGFFLHYIVPQLRKQLPWLCIARPLLRSEEYDKYQIQGPAKIMWFERVYVYLCFIERNIFYPLLFVAALTEDAPRVANKFGVLTGALIVVVCGIKCLRSSYSDQSSQYMILTFTALFFKYDYSGVHESFLIDYFIMAVLYHKTYELLLKVQFVVTYIAPWQITWGSAFHAFAQPFSVPHSAMLFLQALISSILSTPLNPFLGSAIFLTSYVRPVKFWERDYNTRRVDHSNTPLSSHLERNLGADDNNLNSIFYEHLTRSLQHSLCGDLVMGRWGPVTQGDCFVLASDYLNCLVHIIELGNGLVTFQMRGLEFRGTYCQQREVEAITEGVEENDGCCCCDPGHLPNMLSVNAAFSQRWLAWEVTAAKYILEGYSISDNSAVSLLQVYDFRKVLITYYVKSIIFYCTRSPKIESWLSSPIILKALQPMQDRNFVDLDPVFNFNIDEDYDLTACGMTRAMFFHVYGEWIRYCAEKTQKIREYGMNSTLVLLCFALSLLGRRTLGAASHNIITSVEFFLYGLHALFKGDFRITCARDEWVFSDMDLLQAVVAPGVRMSLKLHQDHFMSPDEYEEAAALYEAICKYEEELVISHEGDPTWRCAVLSGTPSLLALRHVLDEGTDEYKIIMLNKRYLSFRVIKINRECVRGLWAGQQQELVYLRNRNPERGSIQNAKQALRNIINSSCDQPIGYPIYVSPLTTSYAETNEQLSSLIGASVSLGKIKRYVLNLFRRIRKRCGEGCSSGGSARDELGMGHEGVYAMTPIATMGSGGGAHHHHHHPGAQGNVVGGGSQTTMLDGSQHFGGSIGRGSSLSRTSLGGGNRGSLASMGKPTSSTLVSLAGLFKERDERATSQPSVPPLPPEEKLLQQQPPLPPPPPPPPPQPEAPDIDEKEVALQKVKITDANVVYDCINLGRRIDVCWPSEQMRARGGRSHWRDWLPEVGMEGQVVHMWSPCHKDPSRRSHVDRTILLVQIEDKFVPIAESGVQDILPSNDLV